MRFNRFNRGLSPSQLEAVHVWKSCIAQHLDIPGWRVAVIYDELQQVAHIKVCPPRFGGRGVLEDIAVFPLETPIEEVLDTVATLYKIRGSQE
jgi:hypothetical protein